MGAGRGRRVGAGRHDGVAGHSPGGGSSLVKGELGGALLHPVVLAGVEGVEGAEQRLQPTQVPQHLHHYMYINRDIRGVFKAELRIQDDLMRSRIPLFILLQIQIRIYIVSKTFNKFYKYRQLFTHFI